MATALLAAILLVCLWLPSQWYAMSEYAVLIPILGAGMRGARRTRLIMTLVFYPCVAAIAWLSPPVPVGPLLGCVFWAVVFAAMWVIGDAYARALESQRKARLTELRQQRQTVARELHDTLAASLAKLVMTTENLRVRGKAEPADLELISGTATETVKELRWIVEMLRDPSETIEPVRAHEATLSGSLARAESQLREHGFSVGVSMRGDLSLLDARQTAILAAVTTEAVNNMIRHGDPTSPAAVLVEVAAKVNLVFINAPRPPSEEAPEGPTFGLQGMAERLAEIGGTVDTDSLPNQWVTRIELPLHQPLLDGRQELDAPAPPLQVIRVLVVDDDLFVRKSISGCLSDEPDIAVVETCEDGVTALAAVERSAPDIVLMDVRMEPTDGVETTRELTRRYPDLKVLALTSFGDDETIGHVFDAGACGLLLKSTPPSAIANAIRAANSGVTTIPGEAIHRRVSVGPRPAEPDLSPREWAVLEALDQGMTNRQIAQEVFVSTSSVKNHINALMRKLDATSRTQVVARAHVIGLLPRQSGGQSESTVAP